MPKNPYPLASLKETAIPIEVMQPVKSRLLSFSDSTMGSPISVTTGGIYLFAVIGSSDCAICFDSSPISLAQATGVSFSPLTMILPAGFSAAPFIIQAPAQYLSVVSLASGASGKLAINELVKWDALATSTQLSFG